MFVLSHGSLCVLQYQMSGNAIDVCIVITNGHLGEWILLLLWEAVETLFKYLQDLGT